MDWSYRKKRASNGPGQGAWHGRSSAPRRKIHAFWRSSRELKTGARAIRRRELRLIVALASSTIYEMESRGEFPRRFNLTPRCVV
ncbi:AlpA family phage regulatory protein [Mesorhizobium intechi]|uniref:AlpA family phage regulatory protein n=1 Tax=Mesorhizobium intechi TaxID=537601 RepID=UPI000CB8DA99|nr:AlpA family phage regulatory protein [Mesorhizobium intechi]